RVYDLVLKDISSDLFQTILYYLYSGKVKSGYNNVINLMKAAEKFQLYGLRDLVDPSKDSQNEIHSFFSHTKKLFQTMDYYDVILITGTEKIPAHRAVLCAQSEYFEVMLKGHFKESYEKEIEMDEDIE